MKPVVNGRFLIRRITGVERYSHEILRGMGDRVRVVHPARWACGAAGYGWEQFFLPFFVRSNEILWSPANMGPLAVQNQVLTLHDLSPLENPKWFTPLFSLWYRLFIPLIVRRVRHITVPSAYVHRKVVNKFHLNNDRVTVVPGGVNTNRFNPNSAPLGGIPERYILYVGSLQARKNLGILLQAWAKISHRLPGVWLVLAGEPNGVFRPVVFPMNQDRVLRLGYVSDDDLPGLYANAEVFVLPSYDEGFGLPILEAMACGTAVIAAQAGAIPEVVGEAARLFNPGREYELVEILEQCLSDPTIREVMGTKGLTLARQFPWDTSARKMGEVLEKCQ